MAELTVFFQRFLTLITAFLMLLFPPNSGIEQYKQLLETNSASIGAAKIIEAVKAKDAEALEELMCQNIKDNVNNLSEEVDELINSIDGEIIESSYRIMNDYRETRPGRKAVYQVGVDICLKTPANTYYLCMVWETANTFAVEETGIRGIVLISEEQVLCVIEATEGVSAWHE
ncbi:MAG: DUF5104 domain-containing protein [Acutalibacteraceae bacterium]|jgi:hypothetical protein